MGSHYSAQRFGLPAPQTVTGSEQAVEKMNYLCFELELELRMDWQQGRMVVQRDLGWRLQQS
jgi:hypothetical protein